MIHLEADEDTGDGERMLDIRLARGAVLPVVSRAGLLVGAQQLLPVRGGVVGTDAFDQFRDRHGRPTIITRERNPTVLRTAGRS